MYTIIDNKVYRIADDKLIENEISNGRLVVTKNVIDKPKAIDNVLSFYELKMKLHTRFEKIEEEEVKPTKKEKSTFNKAKAEVESEEE
jgi:hypothetical protein